MTEQTAPEGPAAPEHDPPARDPGGPAAQLGDTRFRVGALIALAVIGGLILWLVLRNSGGSSSSQTSTNASSVTVDQIKTLAASVGHPVFWVGPKPGYTYELTQTPNGSIYIRYLPPGVKVGIKTPYLTVATYPFTNAYGAIEKVAAGKGITSIKLSHGGLAEVSKQSPESVHAAYPGVNYQVEIYDPTAGTATGLVATGRLAALGKLRAASTSASGASSTSPAALASLARSLGHPLYWLGARNGYTYELTRTRQDQVYIRYLPPGVKVGAREPYTTIGTFPFHGAFAAILAVARQKNATTIKLPNGGRAVVTSNNPKDIHLAYPGGQYEIEVFDPSAARARQIVSSGRLTPIG
jgi:hypothetical protein